MGKKSIIDMASNSPYPSSLYFGKVKIDFEGLPSDIVDGGIIRFFERRIFPNYPNISEWPRNWQKYLDTVPSKYLLLTVQKGIEYGKLSFAYHVEHECRPQHFCEVHETWQRIIDYAEDIRDRIQPQDAAGNTTSQQTEQDERNPEFTTARQVLAIHYLLTYCNAPKVDDTVTARFVQFLTGKETGAKTIVNTTIYKRVRNMLSLSDAASTKDLQYVRNYFVELGISDIVKMIENEINSRDL